MGSVQDIELNFDTNDAEHALSNFAKKMVKTFEKMNFDPLAQLEEDIQKTEKNIDEIEDKIQKISELKIHVNDREIAEVSNQLDEVRRKTDEFANLHAGETLAPKEQEEWDNLLVTIEELENKLVELEDSNIDLVDPKELDENIQLNTELENQKHILEALKTQYKELKNSENATIETAQRSTRTHRIGLLSILKYAIGIRSLFTLFSRLRSAAKEGLGSVATYSPILKQSIDSITNSFNQMKTATGGAISSLVTSLAPIIIKIASLFTIAANAVARFFAILTGRKTVVQASTDQTKFAKAVGGAGKALKNETKEIKNNLAAFDDLNVLAEDTADNMDDVGSGIGGGGMAFQEGAVEEIPIDESKYPLLVKIRDIIQTIWGLIQTIWGYLQPILQPIWDWIVKLVNDGLDWIQKKLDDLAAWFEEHKNTPEATAMSVALGVLILSIIGLLILLIKGFRKTSDPITTATTNFTNFLNLLGTAAVIASVALLLQGLASVIGSVAGLIETMNDAGWDASNLFTVLLAILIPIAGAFALLVAFATPLSAALIELGIALIPLAITLPLIGAGIDLLAIGFEKILNAIVDLITRPLAQLIEFIDKIQENGTWMINNVPTLVKQIHNVLSEYKTTVKGMKSESDSLVKELKKYFGDIQKYINENVLTSIENRFSTFQTNFKNMLNTMIDHFNTFANAIATAVDSIAESINNLAFDVPDWVPDYGGKSLYPDVQGGKHISLPRLATGGVLPPNKPFLAMLGDQRQGTNIEAPLDTIVQAMEQALSGMNYMGNQEIVLNIDGTTLARLTVPNTLNELHRRGYNVKILEGK